MDGNKSKDLHLFTVKRKRDISPPRKESEYRVSNSGVYRMPAGVVVISNGNRGDKAVSKEQSTGHFNGVRGYDGSRSERPIPTGPRNTRERYRPSQVSLISRKSSDVGHSGSQSRSNLQPKGFKSQNTKSSLQERLPSGEFMSRSQRDLGNVLPSIQRSSNNISKSIDMSKGHHQKSVSALLGDGFGLEHSTPIRKDNASDISQREHFKCDEIPQVNLKPTIDDRTNDSSHLNAHARTNLLAQFERVHDLKINDKLDNEQDLSTTKPETLEKPLLGKEIVSFLGEREIDALSRHTSKERPIISIAIDHTCVPPPIAHVQQPPDAQCVTNRPAILNTSLLSSHGTKNADFKPDTINTPYQSGSGQNGIHTSATDSSISGGSNVAQKHPGEALEAADNLPSFSFSREDSPMLASSASSMSISSGSSPIRPNSVSLSPSRSSSFKGERAATCIRCKLPAAQLKTLVQCTSCKHHYHTHCHSPVITVTSGKPDVDPNVWLCSRCIKQRPSPNIGTMAKKFEGRLTPTNGPGDNYSSRDHKRRKLESGSKVLLASENEISKQNTCLHKAQEHVPVLQSEKFWERKESSSRVIVEDFQANIKASDIGSSKTTISGLQSFPSQSGSLLEKGCTLNHSTNPNSIVPSEVRDIQTAGQCLDEDEPMDLDSPIETGFCSPIRIMQTETGGLEASQRSSVRLSSGSPQYNPGTPSQSMDNETTQDINDGMESNHSSPPYSPRLDDDDEFIRSPIIHPQPAEPLAHILPAADTILQYSINTALSATADIANTLFLQFPLAMPPSVPPVPLAPTFLPTALPTTIRTCEDCKTSFSYIDGERSDQRMLWYEINQCLLPPCDSLLIYFASVPCIVRNNSSLRQGNNHSIAANNISAPEVFTRAIPFNNVHPRGSDYEKARVPPRRFAHPDKSSRIGNQRHGKYSSIAGRPLSQEQPCTEISQTEQAANAEFPLRRITTQEILAEKYKSQPEIFPSTSRLPPTKDIAKIVEERTTAISSKDRAESKDEPRKRLTIEEYAQRRKEKTNGKMPSVGEPSLKSRTSEVLETHPEESDTVYAAEPAASALSQKLNEQKLNAADVSRHLSEKLCKEIIAEENPAQEGCPEKSSDASPSASTFNVLSSLEQQKSTEEVALWKKKYEEQLGFVTNYVKQNNKIMGKLNDSEKKKTELERKVAELEALAKTRELEVQIRQKELEIENEKLRLEYERSRIQMEYETSRPQEETVMDDTIIESRDSCGEARTAPQSASQLADLIDKSPDDDKPSISLKEFYKHMTFDIDDPMRNAIGFPPSASDRPPDATPAPRFSKSRKAEFLLFDGSNMNKLHVHREVDRTANGSITGTSASGRAASASSRSTSVTGDTDIGNTVSWDEFAKIPQNIIPVLKDGVLAFRSGQINARSKRLERNVPHFKVGRDVPGELRGLK